MSRNSILSIISNESSGYPYMIGSNGEINTFQINPIIVPFLFSSLKQSKERDDEIYKKILKIDSVSFNEFKAEIIKSPEKNTALGMYLVKRLQKLSRNEAHLVLLYNLGGHRFSELPEELKNRIISGMVQSYSNIKPQEIKITGISYLYRYFKKKEYFQQLEEIFTKHG